MDYNIMVLTPDTPCLKHPARSHIKLGRVNDFKYEVITGDIGVNDAIDPYS